MTTFNMQDVYNFISDANMTQLGDILTAVQYRRADLIKNAKLKFQFGDKVTFTVTGKRRHLNGTYVGTIEEIMRKNAKVYALPLDRHGKEISYMTKTFWKVPIATLTKVE